jgi:hypothetical protein
MSQSFPNRIESVNSDWLTRVLRQHGSLKSGSVSGFRVEALDDGYTSAVYRLHLTLDAAEVTAPRSMIVKFHATSIPIRKTFEALGIYQKEVEFYQFAGTNEQLPVPICYTAEFDAASGDFVLVLEDMSAARPGSWEIDPLGDVRIALPQLARIHAQFWGDPRLRRFDWVVKPFEGSASSLHRSEWEVYLHKLKMDYRDQWPENLWELCERILRHWDDIMRCMSLDTHTLVHTDAHLGQMFFPTEQLPRFVLFDWQYPCKALAAEDVTHLIVNELSVEDRREHEAALVEFYYQSLCREGVADVSLERLWFQCKLSLMWLILMYFRTVAEPDLLQRLKDEADAAGDKWQDWVFGHLGPAISDWDMHAVVDQAIAEAERIKP